MAYSYNTKNEKPPKRKTLLPPGWRSFVINDCKEEMSKQNNHMFHFFLTDKETQATDDLYALTAEGKRWTLKLVLEACGITENENGDMNWDIKDVLNKEIDGLVEHEPNSYIDRNGNTVNAVQHRIVDIKKLEW